jgi:uncharacterized protein (TIGR02145 family)
MSTNNNCATCGPSPQVTVAPPPVCAGELCVDIVKTDCVRYQGPAIACNGQVVVSNGESLTSIIKDLVTLTCTDACCTVPEVVSVANTEFIIICAEETASCAYDGRLYNWFALNAGIEGNGRATNGLVNVNAAVNPDQWRIPSESDWNVTIQALDSAANLTNAGWNNVAGGSLKSTTCWSTPNSGATNAISFNAISSVFREGNGLFSVNNGQIAKYWAYTATNSTATTAYSFSLLSNDDLVARNTAQPKTSGLRVRLVRTASCNETHGEIISDAYTDNFGYKYNGVVINNLVWLTSDLKDTKNNTGATIANVSNDTTWGTSLTPATCLPLNNSNYTTVYATGCTQKKISFPNFATYLNAGGSGSQGFLDLSTLQTCCTTNTASIANLNITIATMQSQIAALTSTGASALSGTGTPNNLPKWNTATQLGNSQIIDSGSAVSINGPVAADTRLSVFGSTASRVAIQGTTTKTGTGSTPAIGVLGSATGANAGTNVGGDFKAEGSTSLNIGVRAIGGASTVKSYGLYAEADSAAPQKFAIVAKDGTQQAGKFLKSITNDGEANWAFITAADISGSVLSGSGSTNAVARWLTNTTLGTGVLFDNNSEVSIGTLPVSTTMLYISAPNTKNSALEAVCAKLGGTSGIFTTNGTGAATNTGIKGSASNSTTENVGVYGVANISSTGNNIGLKGEAANGANSYAIQLVDGSETAIGGKFLKDTGAGKARWTAITAADITGVVSAVGGTNNYVVKFTPNGTTLGNSQILDNTSCVSINSASVTGSRFYVLSNTDTNTIHGKNGATNGIGVFGESGSTGGTSTGVHGLATGAASTNIGVYGKATSGSTKNIGVKAEASGTGSYALQVDDPSKGTGKFLKCVTTDGDASWASLTAADVPGIITGSGTQYFLPIWGAGGNVLSNSPINVDGTTPALLKIGTTNTATFNTTTGETDFGFGGGSRIKFTPSTSTFQILSTGTSTAAPVLDITSTVGQVPSIVLNRQPATGNLILNDLLFDIKNGTHAMISSFATENHTSTAKGKNLKFKTVANTTNITQDVLELTQDGYVKIGSTSTYKLPKVDGTNGQTLITDGAGALTWGTQAAAITGTAGELPLFTTTNTVTSDPNFTFVNIPGSEVGFRLFDGISDNMAQVGISYINLETEGLTQDSALRLANWSDDITRKGAISFRKSRGSIATPESVVTNDKLGTLLFTGTADNVTNSVVSGTTVGIIEVNAASDYTITQENASVWRRNALAEFKLFLGASANYAAQASGFPNDLVLKINGDGVVSFKNYIFPTTGGLAGQVLTSNGASPAQLSWVTPAGGSGTITGSGTSGKVTRWTGTTAIADSSIFDNGTTIGIGVAQSGYAMIEVFSSATTSPYGIRAKTSYNASGLGFNVGPSIAAGIHSTADGLNALANYGVYGIATSSLVDNIGGVFEGAGQLAASNGIGAKVTGSHNIPNGLAVGIQAIASGLSTFKYAAWLQDGTQATNKFLKSVTNDGKANWAYPIHAAQVMCSDLTTTITADTVNKKAFWIAPCDGYITEIFADLDVAQSSGSVFTIDVKKSGTSIFSTIMTIDNAQSSSLNSSVQNVISSTPRTFTKGQKYEIYVTQAGTAPKGLMVSINYERRS